VQQQDQTGRAGARGMDTRQQPKLCSRCRQWHPCCANRGDRRGLVVWGVLEDLDVCGTSKTSTRRKQPSPPSATARLQAPACY